MQLSTSTELVARSLQCLFESLSLHGHCSYHVAARHITVEDLGMAGERAGNVFRKTRVVSSGKLSEIKLQV